MTVGIVKWFDPALGYGYICPSDGSPDVFVHFTALDMAGLETLGTGQLVSYLPSREGRVLRATQLRIAAAA